MDLVVVKWLQLTLVFRNNEPDALIGLTTLCHNVESDSSAAAKCETFCLRRGLCPDKMIGGVCGGCLSSKIFQS